MRSSHVCRLLIKHSRVPHSLAPSSHSIGHTIPASWGRRIRRMSCVRRFHATSVQNHLAIGKQRDEVEEELPHLAPLSAQMPAKLLHFAAPLGARSLSFPSHPRARLVLGQFLKLMNCDLQFLHRIIQRSAKVFVLGCEKFVPALAHLFCPALPGSCFARFSYFFADLCVH